MTAGAQSISASLRSAFVRSLVCAGPPRLRRLARTAGCPTWGGAATLIARPSLRSGRARRSSDGAPSQQPLALDSLLDVVAQRVVRRVGVLRIDLRRRVDRALDRQ